ncbi:MAG: phosphoribosylanthranilate isomerase [Pseudomonadota bacterium]
MVIEAKLCGFTEPETVRVAVDAGAKWIGFNFAPGSPRRVKLADIDRLLPATGAATAVGLLVDADDALVESVLATGIGTIQLHGNETPERIAELADRVPGEVWKAIGIESEADLAEAHRYRSADRLLIDARPPHGSDQKGGNGVPFDWNILKDWHPPKPWFLAGGLVPETVAEAVALTGSSAVDVSSGIERERGVKDANLIREFMRSVKGI